MNQMTQHKIQTKFGQNGKQDSVEFVDPNSVKFANQNPEEFAKQNSVKFVDQDSDEFFDQDSDKFVNPDSDEHVDQDSDESAGQDSDESADQDSDESIDCDSYKFISQDSYNFMNSVKAYCQKQQLGFQYDLAKFPYPDQICFDSDGHECSAVEMTNLSLENFNINGIKSYLDHFTLSIRSTNASERMKFIVSYVKLFVSGGNIGQVFDSILGPIGVSRNKMVILSPTSESLGLIRQGLVEANIPFSWYADLSSEDYEQENFQVLLITINDLYKIDFSDDMLLLSDNPEGIISSFNNVAVDQNGKESFNVLEDFLRFSMKIIFTCSKFDLYLFNFLTKYRKGADDHGIVFHNENGNDTVKILSEAQTMDKLNSNRDWRIVV